MPTLRTSLHARRDPHPSRDLPSSTWENILRAARARPRRRRNPDGSARCHIPGIRPGNRMQHQHGVLDAARHRPQLVERPAQRHRAGARHAAVSGPQPGDPAAHRRADDAAVRSRCRSKTPPVPPPLPRPARRSIPTTPSSSSHGFIVCPPNQMSFSASAPRLSLATSTAPASCSRFTTAASAAGTRLRNGSAP